MPALIGKLARGTGQVALAAAAAIAVSLVTVLALLVVLCAAPLRARTA